MSSESTAPALERRLRHREDARRTILDAAEELLVEGGLEGFSMRRLAHRCGYTAPTIYHYFRDKPTLVDQLLEERLRRLAAELREVERGEDAGANLRRLSDAFARWGRRNPSHYQLLMMNRGPSAPRPPSTEEVEGLFLEALDALATPGELSEIQRETLRQGLWSLLHGFILLQTTHPEEDWVPGLLDHSVDAMVRGWLRLVGPEGGGA